MFFPVVVFMVVGMFFFFDDETLCGFWWVRVESDHSFPAAWSLRWSVRSKSFILVSFLMERQVARAAHPACKTEKTMRR